MSWNTRSWPLSKRLRFRLRAIRVARQHKINKLRRTSAR